MAKAMVVVSEENERGSAFCIEICKRVGLKLVGSWFCTCKSHHISWDLGHMGYGLWGIADVWVIDWVSLHTKLVTKKAYGV